MECSLGFCPGQHPTGRRAHPNAQFDGLPNPNGYTHRNRNQYGYPYRYRNCQCHPLLYTQPQPHPDAQMDWDLYSFLDPDGFSHFHFDRDFH